MWWPWCEQTAFLVQLHGLPAGGRLTTDWSADSQSQLIWIRILFWSVIRGQDFLFSWFRSSPLLDRSEELHLFQETEKICIKLLVCLCHGVTSSNRIWTFLQRWIKHPTWRYTVSPDVLMFGNPEGLFWCLRPEPRQNPAGGTDLKTVLGF